MRSSTSAATTVDACKVKRGKRNTSRDLNAMDLILMIGKQNVDTLLPRTALRYS
jgi:hypothetical protein